MFNSATMDCLFLFTKNHIYQRINYGHLVWIYHYLENIKERFANIKTLKWMQILNISDIIDVENHEYVGRV